MTNRSTLSSIFGSGVRRIIADLPIALALCGECNREHPGDFRSVARYAEALGHGARVARVDVVEDRVDQRRSTWNLIVPALNGF
jgi:hypothetical protein